MNARGLRILTEFYRTPWALHPDTLELAAAVLHRWAAGVSLSEEDIRTAVGQAPEASRARAEHDTRAGGNLIAVLPVFGIIGHRAHLVDDVSSGVGTSTELFGKAFRSALRDPAVGAIVLDVDSPGGSAFGTGELAEEIFAARGTKPIVASVNSVAASAAYWIASAADEIVITPGGQAGSIGVWTMHQDHSKFMEKEGISVTLISAGKYKTEGHRFGPLPTEAREAIQGQVDQVYDQFVRGVARNRRAPSMKAVREGYGEGRMLLADDAVKENIVDRIGTFDQVIADLRQKLSKSGGGSRTHAEAAHRTRQLEIASRQ